MLSTNQLCAPNSFTERFWQQQTNSKTIPVSTKGIFSLRFLKVLKIHGSTSKSPGTTSHQYMLQATRQAEDREISVTLCRVLKQWDWKGFPAETSSHSPDWRLLLSSTHSPRPWFLEGALTAAPALCLVCVLPLQEGKILKTINWEKRKKKRARLYHYS